jgi:hypothetical protein
MIIALSVRNKDMEPALALSALKPAGNLSGGVRYLYGVSAAPFLDAFGRTYDVAM